MLISELFLFKLVEPLSQAKFFRWAHARLNLQKQPFVIKLLPNVNVQGPSAILNGINKNFSLSLISGRIPSGWWSS